MLSFLKNILKKKPTKQVHCAQCGNLIGDKEYVFVFDHGTVVTHNYVNCVWGWLKDQKRNMRNVRSVLLKDIKKTLP